MTQSVKPTQTARFGVVVFPGSNCDRDCVDAVEHFLSEPVEIIWHAETGIPKGIECLILPGGFSYGDYLRSGAIAQFAPIMNSIKSFAASGGLVIGICNGFQILTESGLLPGALMRNNSLKFKCQQVLTKIENNTTPFTTAYGKDDVITLPIAHADGCYVADTDLVSELEANNQVVLRYIDDVNGSVNQIAGICNKAGNVFGLMPHPERNMWKSPAFTGEGGRVFSSIQAHLNQQRDQKTDQQQTSPASSSAVATVSAVG